MIPKIIHYCWFGGKELPELAQKCIESWKDKCSDYKIMRWDESTFDVNCIPYVKEAYENKKFAFVADYARLWALYTYGGVYMDTDVEVCRPIDAFLEERAFTGFESYADVQAGVIAGEKGFSFFKDLQDYYTDRHFINEKSELDLTTIVVIVTEALEKKGLKRNNTKQTVSGLTVFPRAYFCPDKDDKLYRKEQIYTIHHGAGSWLPEDVIKKINSPSYKIKEKTKEMIRRVIITVIGEENFNKLRGRE
jgi:mannosyltransferase OCH1-like enzyme